MRATIEAPEAVGAVPERWPRPVPPQRPERPVALDRFLLGAVALFALLRLPSFLEPHWYTDEAGYVTTAQAALRGGLLYAQVWTNKPPLQIWTVAAVVRTLGTSEAALHVLPWISGLLTLLAVDHAARRLLGPRRRVGALVLAAILLGTPLFDAELILPESLLIAPITWAGALVVTRIAAPDLRPWPRWPLAAGLLAGVAVAYQQTALAETCAFGLLLALSPSGSRSRRVAIYAAGFAVVSLLWLVPSVTLAGPGTVARALVGFWVPFTQSRYPVNGGGVAIALLLPAAVLTLLVVAAWLLRRDPSPTWRPWVWAGAALLVPTVARQPYPHYLLPSVAPTALVLAGLRLPARRGARTPPRRTPSRSQRLGLGSLAAGFALAVWGGSVAGADWVVPFDAGSAGLAAYYGGAMATLAGGESLAAYQDGFDRRVPEDAAVAAWISAHGLDGAPAVVWSSDAWVYADAHLRLLLPTPPIYNDVVLVGGSGALARRVRQLRPELVVTLSSSMTHYPGLQPVLSAGYTEVDRSGGEAVWLRDGVVGAVRGTSSRAGG